MTHSSKKGSISKAKESSKRSGTGGTGSLALDKASTVVNINNKSVIMRSLQPPNLALSNNGGGSGMNA